MRSLSLGVSDPGLLPWAQQLVGALGHANPDWALTAIEGAGDVSLEAVQGSPGAPAPLEVLAVLRRTDPRDALLVNDALRSQRVAELSEDPHSMDPADPLRALPLGAPVTAHGALRTAQIREARPDLIIRESELGDDAVLAAWVAGETEAAIVGAWLLDQAGMEGAAARRLDPPWIGEPGAAAYWIYGPWEADLRELLLPLDDRPSRVEVLAERAVQAAMPLADGVSLGVRATSSQARLELSALLVDPHQEISLRGRRAGEATIRGAGRLAAVLGRSLAEKAAGTLTVVT